MRFIGRRPWNFRHFIDRGNRCCHYCDQGNRSTRPCKEPLPLAYDSALFENDWYSWWEKRNQFKSKSNRDQQFIMCFPPPNVTGALHIGHALTVAIQDTLVRWHRMKGDNAVWIPGFDHAGIATQTVVEKKLQRERGLMRINLNRSDFIDECGRWTQEKVQTITDQLKRLGASLDWSNCYYTMDQNFSTAVVQAFAYLHKNQSIFRAERLVNWCPRLRSTLSDIEVDRVELHGNNNEAPMLKLGQRSIAIGRLFFVSYAIEGETGRSLTVATTRPETIPADVALAVHPDDARFSHYVGKFAKNPLNDGAPIPIVADIKVDPNTGSGVLKVTPGHDRVDYEIGQRHDLPLNVRCLDENGMMTKSCGKWAGLDRFDAREEIVNELKNRGLLKDVICPSSAVVPICSRTGDVVEQMLKQQWFVDLRRMSAAALNALDEGRLKITPAYNESIWRHWLSQPVDWCISRQLWWGHRIPAYRHKLSSEWYVAESVSEALKQVRIAHPNAQLSDLEQDEDVLDTWFSSSLVPLVARGFPETSSERISLLETGSDIVGFWVTRMVMMSLELTGKLPFKEILLHGIVRDAGGRKMSKSLGNVIDPLDVIDGVQLPVLLQRLDESSLPSAEIQTAKVDKTKEFPDGILRCGADALRFGLLQQDVKSEHINLDIFSIINKRNFCNKMWQAFNFLDIVWQKCLDNKWRSDEKNTLDFAQLPKMELWLLSRLSRLIRSVNDSLENYDFQVATGELQRFLWHDFCDIYLEWMKSAYIRSNDSDLDLGWLGDLLMLILQNYVRLSAPFMPFLSEELYGRLMNVQKQSSLSASFHLPTSVHESAFPVAKDLERFIDPDLERQFEKAKNIIDVVRSIRVEFGLAGREQISGVVFGDETLTATMANFGTVVDRLSRMSVNECRPLSDWQTSVKPNCIWQSVDDHTLISVDLRGIDQTKLQQRLSSQISKLTKKLAKSEQLSRKRLRQPEFEHPVKDDSVRTELDRLQKIYNNLRL